MLRITEPTDPRLDDYRHLTDAAARQAIERPSGPGQPSDRHQGIFIVEGVLALERLLTSGHRVRSVLLSPRRAETMGGALEGRGFPVLVGERDLLAGVTGFDVHRGVLAAVDRRPLPDIDTLLGPDGGADPRRLVVAEHLSDNENLGSLFRNAAALGIDAVVLDRRCADPLYRRSIRVSLGWSLVLPTARVDSVVGAVPTLHRHGFRVVGLTPSADAAPVDRLAATGGLADPVAFVVGAEGPGLDDDTLAAVDARVRIPMSGPVDSLNVATSLAVVAAFAAATRDWS